MEHSEAYQFAKMSFYTHLMVYIAIILLLVVINLLSSPGTIWFHWPMMGWGIAVVLHGFAVFVLPGRFAVTEKMIQKEMNKSQTHS